LRDLARAAAPLRGLAPQIVGPSNPRSDTDEDCRGNQKALQLAWELQAILHERIEQLRDKTAGLPFLPRAKHKVI